MDAFTIIEGSAFAVITSYAAWTLYAILSGRLIPRSWVTAMRAQDKIVEEDLRQRLKDANESTRIEREQKELLLHEIGPTITKLISSLPEKREGQ